MSYPLLKALDALLIVLFGLAWLSVDRDMFGSMNTPTWPSYLGVLIDAELGLVLLLVLSVAVRLLLRSVAHAR